MSRVGLAWGVILGYCTALPLSAQIVTTVAGSTFVFRGDGGPAISAPLGRLRGVAVDPSGNIFATDLGNEIVVKVTPAGVLAVVAGNGAMGFSGDGGPATSASFFFPSGLAVDTDGNLYIADTNNNRIRKVTPAGIISTVAGNGTGGFSGDGGLATSASLRLPSGVAVDTAGNLFIADQYNHRIRKVTPAGIISTVAGDGNQGASGDGGPATLASLSLPFGVAVDAASNLYIADTNNNRIRKVDPSGTISTVVGNGTQGFSGDGGLATSASLNQPYSVARDAAGNLYIADGDNHRVRKVTPAGIISTVAGNGTPTFSGDRGPAASASLNSPFGVAVDATGNLYIADWFNHRIRRVTPAGTITSVAGNGEFQYSGDGGPATSASLNVPQGVAVDTTANLFIADTTNHRIRKVTPTGAISTIVGNGTADFSGDGGPATNASLRLPSGVAVDAGGNLYIADTSNHVIRKVTPAGTIATVAGNGTAAFSGDGGPATSASLSNPSGVAVDAGGNLYIVDRLNNRIRRVTPTGTISTVAGNGTAAFSGDGGPAASASLNLPASSLPAGVALDTTGNLYFADIGNSRIRKVTPAGIITTVTGNGVRAFSGDGGPATSASLFSASGVAVDAAGNLYIADSNNHRIRKVTPAGTISTVAGNGTSDFSGDGGPATSASLSLPNGVAVDVAGNLYIADRANGRIRKVGVTASSFTVTPPSLSFSAITEGTPPGQRLTVSSEAAGLAWTASATTQSGGNWLTISPASGTVPGMVTASVNLAGLAPGTYRGAVTVQAPLASPSTRTVNVELVLVASPSARLAVEPSSVTIAAGAGTGAPAAQTLRVTNTGGGTLNWTARTQTTFGGNWLGVSPSSGAASSGSPAVVQVTASSSALEAGTYLGALLFEGATTGQIITVPVTLLVSQVRQTVLLSQSGLLFTAVEGGAIVPAQSFGILNTGQGAMGWAVDASTLAGGNWLSATPSSGSSTAGAVEVPLVEVRVNVSGLLAGQYSGLVQVRAAGANNSPQFVTVTLNVLPPGSALPPLVRPTGLIFVRQAGTSSPGSQTVHLATAVPGTTEAVLNPFTFSGNWLDVLPRNVAFSPADSRTVVVLPALGTLASGEYFGALTLLFSDFSSQTINVLFVVTPPGSASGADGETGAFAPCIPQKLLGASRTLTQSFSAPAGWPSQIQAQVKDDCDNPIANATVIASFSNGDPPLALVSLQNGLYEGSWRPTNAGQTQVMIRAVAPPLLAATIRVDGQTTGNAASVPAMSAGGIVHAATYAGGALAPGSIVSVFGTNMAVGQNQATQKPLPRTLGEATLTIGGTDAPLFYSRQDQINALLPFELPANSTVQAVLKRSNTMAVPETIALTPARPGIFTINQRGTGQGAMLDARGRLVDSATPVAGGETVQVFCTGLGATQPAVRSGDAAPAAEPLARVTTIPTATVGGVPARVTFAGLAPGFVGLYQVNVEIPAGLAPGDAAPLVLSQNGVPSNTVTLAVR